MDDSSDLAGALVALAEDFVGLGSTALDITDGRDLLEAVARMGQARIDGAEWVSITTLTGRDFQTVASTDPRAVAADLIQYEVNSGPCVDAILDDTTFHVSDLVQDDRWPAFGPRVAREVGAHSMLSFRLALEDQRTIAALNVYSSKVDAFDPSGVATGALVATYGALGLNSLAGRRRAEHLQRALESAREIGIAIGVLMSSGKLTRDQAFQQLRETSQNGNRKLRDVAVYVAETGRLPEIDGATGAMN
jgi:hypothetical protein